MKALNTLTLALCLLGVNLLSFLVYGLDKLLALRKRRRIPEASLLTLALLGGSPGAMTAMTVFHHKTDAKAHPAFVWGIPVMFLAQLILGWVLASR